MPEISQPKAAVWSIQPTVYGNTVTVNAVLFGRPYASLFKINRSTPILSFQINGETPRAAGAVWGLGLGQNTRSALQIRSRRRSLSYLEPPPLIRFSLTVVSRAMIKAAMPEASATWRSARLGVGAGWWWGLLPLSRSIPATQDSDDILFLVLRLVALLWS
jgi:hypothetical protein